MTVMEMTFWILIVWQLINYLLDTSAPRRKNVKKYSEGFCDFCGLYLPDKLL